MIAGEILDDANGFEMIGLAQMQDLFDDFDRCSVGRVLGDRFLVDQPCFAILLVE